MPPRCKNPNQPADNDPGYVTYLEPYFGGGSVLFANNPEGISEVVSDLDSELTDFWRCLQDDSEFAEFSRIVSAIPLSQAEWRAATGNGEFTRGRVARAVAFFVRNRQSRQGLEKDFATLTRKRTRRGMNEQVAAWLTAVDGLPWFHARLRRVLILHDPAVEVLKDQNDARLLAYLDPTYLHETRVTTADYKHEMSYGDHVELLSLLGTEYGDVDWTRVGADRPKQHFDELLSFDFQGRFILSGYHSPLYDSTAAANGWSLTEIKIDNKASSKTTKPVMTECLWRNYE